MHRKKSAEISITTGEVLVTSEVIRILTICIQNGDKNQYDIKHFMANTINTLQNVKCIRFQLHVNNFTSVITCDDPSSATHTF